MIVCVRMFCQKMRKQGSLAVFGGASRTSRCGEPGAYPVSDRIVKWGAHPVYPLRALRPISDTGPSTPRSSWHSVLSCLLLLIPRQRSALLDTTLGSRVISSKPYARSTSSHMQRTNLREASTSSDGGRALSHNRTSVQCPALYARERGKEKGRRYSILVRLCCVFVEGLPLS